MIPDPESSPAAFCRQILSAAETAAMALPYTAVHSLITYFPTTSTGLQLHPDSQPDTVKIPPDWYNRFPRKALPRQTHLPY